MNVISRTSDIMNRLLLTIVSSLMWIVCIAAYIILIAIPIMFMYLACKYHVYNLFIALLLH